MMQIFLLGLIVIAFITFIFRFKKLNKPSNAYKFEKNRSVEIRENKTHLLLELQNSFIPPNSVEEGLQKIENTINRFILNHGQTTEHIKSLFVNLKLPEEIPKKEIALRKFMGTFYKERESPESKSLAIYIAFEHIKLQLKNQDFNWKKFDGLKKIQSNWKSDEYFDALLTLMFIFLDAFNVSEIHKNLTEDIKKIFELWTSQNIAKSNYEECLLSFEKSNSSLEAHFAIFRIIEYLERRYKYNPTFRNDLIQWCEKDIHIYEKFLIEFYKHELFSIDDLVGFAENPEVENEKLAKVSFSRVKQIKNYTVPRLNSYDVLENIFSKENNEEKLAWLRKIGIRIGYIKDELGGRN